MQLEVDEGGESGNPPGTAKENKHQEQNKELLPVPEFLFYCLLLG
jgi:hypothetical protein